MWFDSGAMPFAQHHFPFEHEQLFDDSYPAQFICEAQDQTRGWFYSLLAIAVLLARPAPYENVVCLGLILDEEGQKMSKSTRQRGRALGGARRLRRGRAALVLLHRQAAVGRLPLLGRDDRRGGAPVPQAAVVHLLLLRPVRARLRGGADRPRHRRPQRSPPSAGRGRARGPRPLGALAHGRHRRAGDRAPGGLRRDLGRAGDRGARGGPLQLVRAPLPAALLGRRGGGLRDPAQLPAGGQPHARPAVPVHRR